VAGLLIAATGGLLLTRAPSDPSYLTNLLPGYLALGFGIGMTFVAVSVTAMSEISAENAGLASGLMTTAHEVGAALGVAVFSAVAAAPPLASSDLAAGYARGFTVAAAVAAGLALVAVLAIPAVRPAAGTRVAVH
jgi:hypothetical protein